MIFFTKNYEGWRQLLLATETFQVGKTGVSRYLGGAGRDRFLPPI